MISLKQTGQPGQAGFTLVELAIVLVIVGLLIGGILKGQELIAATRVNSTASQIKAIDAASYTFRDTYGGIPGDLANATTRVPNCVVLRGCAPGTDADGNLGDGQLNDTTDALAAIAVSATATTEGTAYFNQLYATDLLGGLQTGGTGADGGVAIGQNVLGTAIESGGNWRIQYSAGDIAGATGTTPANVHYMHLSTAGVGAAVVIAGAEAAANIDTLGIFAKQAAAIDSKIDDGQPGRGSVVATGSEVAPTGVVGCVSSDAATATYNTQNSTVKSCGLLVQVLQ